MTSQQPTAISAQPRARGIAAEIQRGLSRPEKHLPCKLFYDQAGSELFERICALPEYYLTRTELRIMTACSREICAALGPRVRLVEFGSGSSTKTRLLLDALEDPAAYVPVDIAADMLGSAVRAMRARYPRLPIEPVCVDYAEPFALPPAPKATARTVCYFPGSTIGNFSDDEAVSFLRRVAAVCGRDGGLLVGADLQKDVGLLLAAYNDAAGVTAEFNRNLLRHVAAVADADFAPDRFEHRAVWNGSQGRIEMQLVSRGEQVVRVGAASFAFRRGEVLTTEYSHKYTLPGFAELAARGGFEVERVWADPDRWFSVQLLRAAPR